MATCQTITAIYDKGVLTPIEKVKLRRRQIVRVKIMPSTPRKVKLASRDRKSARAERVQLAREAFGMWANREDIGDAVEWTNALRASWEERLKEIYKDA
ncbi:MAG: antitoxin family protein [Anaerolineae bacterium]|nr:antitoxin family protein [Anaerolineae bacterium]